MLDPMLHSTEAIGVQAMLPVRINIAQAVNSPFTSL